MPIRFACECGRKFKAREDKVGAQVKCPDCGNIVTVPAVDAPLEPQPEPEPEEPMISAAEAATNLMKGVADKAKEKHNREIDPSVEGGGRRRRGRVFGGATATPTQEQRDKDERTELVREALQLYGPKAAAVLVGCALLYWAVSAMVAEELDLPPLGEVSGRVTYDGDPLEGARISFLPQLQGTSQTAGKIASSSGTTDSDGYYELTYIQTDDDVVMGASVGNHVVEIIWMGPNGEGIPGKYQDGSALKAKVEEGSNEFNFKLLSIE